MIFDNNSALHPVDIFSQNGTIKAASLFTVKKTCMNRKQQNGTKKVS